MNCIDIKKSIINPLLIFDNIIGAQLPDECMSYSSTVYQTFYELFDELFRDMDISRLDNVLLKKGITNDILEKILKNKRKSIQWFCSLMDIIILDVMNIQKRRCYALKDNKKIIELKSDYRKLLPILSIDNTVMCAEINSNSLFVDFESANKMAVIISTLICNITDALMHPEKECNNMSRTNDTDNLTVEWDYDVYGNLYFNILKKDKIGIDNSFQKMIQRELVSNVNTFDKKLGVDLYNPSNVIIDGDDLFERIMHYRVILSRMVLILNSIDADNYIDEHTIFGTELKRIKLNSNFKKISSCFDDTAYDIKTNKFIPRFLTYMYVWIIKDLDFIANKWYKISDDREFIEFDIKMNYIDRVVYNLSKLTSSMLTGGVYDDYLLFFNEIQIYLNTNMKNYKKNMKKIDNIYSQGDLLSYNLRRFSGGSQDVSMDTLLKLAYHVTVSAPSAKNVVDFCLGYKFKNKFSTRYLIEQLGRSIIDDSRRYGLQKMFKFFLNSGPYIYSSFEYTNNESLVGALALVYYSFLVNDKRICKAINKII